MEISEKLRILADSAKYDVACSTSGTDRNRGGRIGSAMMAGCCHSWSADGRCISLLKVLLSNKCIYDCAYCTNRRSSSIKRASFSPKELADLTIGFYKRNYIEGLFISSAVERSPDHTSENMLECLRILRQEYGFAGYIHTKIIPGTDPVLIHAIGLMSDRLSVNAEFPSKESLSFLAPQKDPGSILGPMQQITNTLVERKSLVGPGSMFKDKDLNGPSSYITSGRHIAGYGSLENRAFSSHPVKSKREIFAPAGQTTQMMIGARKESDRDILYASEQMYRIFKMKRVYFSAYVALEDSPLLPPPGTLPPLKREHRLYQADWLLRFYGFRAHEFFDDEDPDLDPDIDPKATWALRHMDLFPAEVNEADLSRLLRIPGVGPVSARRIVHQRKYHSVDLEDLKKMGVVLKRAIHFLTCNGKYYGGSSMDPSSIRSRLLDGHDGVQMDMFSNDFERDRGQTYEKLPL